MADILVREDATGKMSMWNDETGEMKPLESSAPPVVDPNISPATQGQIQTQTRQPITSPSQLRQLPPSQPEMTDQKFTQARQKMATSEPAFKTLSRATIPTLATAASIIPGVGLAAGSLIGAGGTAWNQALGQEESNPTEIAKSFALPYGVGKGVQGLVMGGKALTRGLGKLV